MFSDTGNQSSTVQARMIMGSREGGARNNYYESAANIKMGKSAEASGASRLYMQNNFMTGRPSAQAGSKPSARGVIKVNDFTRQQQQAN